MNPRQTGRGGGDQGKLGCFALPADFQIATIEEIEQDLELGKPGWKGLVRSPEIPRVQPASPGRDQSRRWRAWALTLGALVAFGLAIGASSTIAISGTGHGIAQTVSKKTCPPFIWTPRGPMRIRGLVCSR